jgi:hypothetical protein
MGKATAEASGREFVRQKRTRGKKRFGHVPLRGADAKRSVENIQRWNSYLPTDCVRAMVRMGWDYTT